MSYADLWPTGDAYVEVRKTRVGKLLHKLKNAFTIGWHARGIGALVERVNDEVDW